MTVSPGTAWSPPSPYHEPGRLRTFSTVFASASTRIAILAIGWLVLDRTNSPVDTAIAVAGLTLPYAVTRLVSTGWIAGTGPRRIAAAADMTSTVTFVGIAVLAQHHTALLVVLAVVVGVLRGLADESQALIAVGEDGPSEGGPPESGSGQRRGVHPFVLAAGGVAGGAVVAWLGVVSTIWLAALFFALCAAITVWQAPRLAPRPEALRLEASRLEASRPEASRPEALRPPPPGQRTGQPADPNREALTGDLVTQEIRIYRPVRDRRVGFNAALTSAFVDFATQAGALCLVLLWVRYVLRSPDALSLVGGAFVVGTFAGCAASTMRQRAVLGYLAVAVGFAGGAIPGVIALQLPGLAWPIALVSFVAGSAMPSGSPVRDIRVDYSGTPQQRLLNDNVSAAIAYAAIPVGILLGATIVERLDSIGGLLAGGALYLLAVGIAAVTRPPLPSEPVGDHVTPAQARYAGVTTWIAVTLTYADGEWMVDVARRNGASGDPHAVKPTDALRAMDILDVPGVREEIEQALAADQARAELEAQRLRDELGDLSLKLSAINEMVELSELRKSTT